MIKVNKPMYQAKIFKSISSKELFYTKINITLNQPKWTQLIEAEWRIYALVI